LTVVPGLVQVGWGQRVGATGETKKAAQRLFGNQALARETRHSLDLAAPGHPYQGVQTDDPSPSAQEFRLLLNGLAASALRREIAKAIKVESVRVR
jgi:hypothetical protein